MPTCTGLERVSFRTGHAVVLSIALFTASGEPAIAAESAPFETRWRRAQSERFTLYSSLSKTQTLQIAREIKRLETVLNHMFHDQPRAGGTPTQVFVFGQPDTFRRYGLGAFSDESADLAGFCTTTPFGNYIVVDAAPGTDGGRVVRHEYTHLHLNQSHGEVPLWLDEGFAEYLSTLRVTRGRVRLGDALSHHLRWLSTENWIPIDSLLDMTSTTVGFDEAHRTGAIHAQSWLLLHYLLHDGGGQPWSPERLVRLEVAFAGNALLDGLGCSAEQLEQRLRTYMLRADLGVATLPASAPRGTVKVQRVGRAPMLTRLGELAAFVHRDTELARSLFSKSLELDPERPGPNAGLGYLDELDGRPAEAASRFARASGARTDVARIPLMHGFGILERFESRAASVFVPADRPDPQLLRARAEFVRSLEIDPMLAEGYAGLGATYLYDAGDPSPGISALERARELQPGRVDLAADLALLHAHAGDLPSSRELMGVVERGTRHRTLIETTRRLLILADPELIDRLVEQGRSEDAELALRSLLDGTTDTRARATLEIALEALRLAADGDTGTVLPGSP